MHAEAEALYLRAIVIMETVLGPDHLEVATTLNNLAGLLYKQVRPVYLAAYVFVSFARRTRSWKTLLFVGQLLPNMFAYSRKCLFKDTATIISVPNKCGCSATLWLGTPFPSTALK